MVAKKRNKAANRNETSGKNEFVMQNMNSNMEESMYPYMLVKGEIFTYKLFITSTYRLTEETK